METVAPWQIVVGVDGSEGGWHALDWARGEIRPRGGGLEVVHVWSPPAPVTEIAVMTMAEAEPRAEREAEAVVAEARDRISTVSDPAVSTRIRAERGSPASAALLEQADGADLLVVGSRGRGGFASLLLGSTSQQVAHHAKGPVAIVPSTAALPGAGDVVVGVDGSEDSARALRWAVDEAAVRGTRLSVVHGWWTAYPIPPGGLALAPADTQRFMDQSQALLHAMVDAAVARSERGPADVELLPIEAPAPIALLDRAGPSDLLVVGSRGRGGFAGLLLGSTSQQCIHHATGAVVIVPHEEP